MVIQVLEKINQKFSASNISKSVSINALSAIQTERIFALVTKCTKRPPMMADFTESQD